MDAETAEFSKTAMLICLNCAILSKDPGYRTLFRDPYAGPLAGAVSAESARLLAELDDPERRRAFIAAGEARNPGLITHVAYRKPWIAAQVRAAVAAGCRQLVVFGAGLDTLALRLKDELADVRVFEIDRPETQTVKRRAVERLFGVPANLRYVPVDFARERVEDKLAQTDYDAGARTVFVAEAVMEYVPPAEVDGIFAFVRRRSAAGSRFAFTHMSPKLNQDTQFHRLHAAVQRGGEPIHWFLAPDQLGAFLAARGFRLLETLTPKQIRNDWIPRHAGLMLNTLGGFYFAVAETLAPA